MKKILIISLLILCFTTLKAQEKDTLIRNNLSFELSTGINDLLYLNYNNDDNGSIVDRKYLTRNNEVNFNYCKARMLYSFDEKWDLALGFLLSNLRYTDTKVALFGQFNLGIDYYPYSYKNNKIGFSFDAGLHTDGTWPSFGLGAYWIHKLSPRFDLVINPAIDFNFYQQETFNPSTIRYYYNEKLRSGILSLNVGIRLNTVHKVDDYTFVEEETPASYYTQKDKSFGFSFGINLLNLEKEKTYNDLTVPLYKNAFYYRTPIYASFDLVYKTKQNYIHSIEFAYNDHDASEPYPEGLYDMNISSKDYIIAYKFEMPLSTKAFKSKESNPMVPYIGLQLMYDNKTFTIKDYQYNTYAKKDYDVDIDSKSNLFLLQLTPSVKRFFNHFYLDLGLNINLAGVASGDYYYKLVTKELTGFINPITSKVTTSYSNFLSPVDMFKNFYLVNNISFKLGYLF